MEDDSTGDDLVNTSAISNDPSRSQMGGDEKYIENSLSNTHTLQDSQLDKRFEMLRKMNSEMLAGMQELATEVKQVKLTQTQQAASQNRTLLPLGMPSPACLGKSEMSRAAPSYAQLSRAEASEVSKHEKMFLEFIMAKADAGLSREELIRLLKARRLYMTAISMVGTASQAAASIFLIKDELDMQDEEFLVNRFEKFTSQAEMRQRMQLAIAKPQLKMEATMSTPQSAHRVGTGAPRGGPSDTARCAVCQDAGHWWRECPCTDKKALFMEQRQKRLVALGVNQPVHADGTQNISGATVSGGAK